MLLTRSVTHELRQPLSLIVGYAELLARPDVDGADWPVLLASIRDAASRLAGPLKKLEHAQELGTVELGPRAADRVLDLRA